jgi:hypothetical protein
MFSVPELPARLRPQQERTAELRQHCLPFEMCNGEASHQDSGMSWLACALTRHMPSYCMSWMG